MFWRTETAMVSEDRSVVKGDWTYKSKLTLQLESITVFHNLLGGSLPDNGGKQ